ncbi:MAG: hypothetical protein RQ936_10635 [Gammaproteobacteria bacterium]|nr:hypothetical protein [Gammaproteobacteria bacterium]
MHRGFIIFIALVSAHAATTLAAPGDVLFNDALTNMNQWSVVSSGGDASIGNETSASGRSMRLRWDTVIATSVPFNAAAPGAELTVWVRRGSDAFSSKPDDGEDILIQYLNTFGTWVTLETFPGAGTAGEIFNRAYNLPSDALHTGLQIRLNRVNGSGDDFDYWHVDDVVVTETAAVISGCDNFESGFNWTAVGTGSAGISGQTFNSPSNSMFLRWDTVTVTSPVTDHSLSTMLDISIWVRRGDNAFSADPDNGEDLVFEYLNNVGNWRLLETFKGNGKTGEILEPVYALPADALHANFQMRFTLLSGSGADADYWHVDDVCQVIPAPPTDHFSIIHDTTAVNCQAEPVTISAHLSDHTVDAGYSGALNLSTSSGNGDWTLITGLGALNNGAADDGVATYTMVPADNGVAVLGLKNTHVEALNINVTDGLISETTGSALAGEDQNLAFAQSGFVFLADGAASNITTQIGGKSSSLAPGNQLLELQAVRSSDSTGACEAALQGANQIELAFECRNPATCSANQVNVNGVNITGNSLGAVGSYAPVNLDFGDATDTTAAFVMNYPDVGAIQLYARYNIPLDDGSGTPSGTFITGNSNAFVVRPFGFDVVVTANPGAAGPADGVFTRAGADFAVSATAVLYQAGDDVLDNNGIPDNHDDADPSNNVNLSDNAAALNYGRETTPENVALTGLLDQPGGGYDPGLTGTTTITGFSSGAGNSAAVRFDEVGIIEITAGVADGDYLGIGAATTAALLGKSGYVGRFIPNHFVVANATLTNRSDSVACLDPFTYMDENFQIDYELAAFNALAPAAITQNYSGAFAKLDLSVPAEMNYGATDSGSNLTARLGVASAGGFVAGTALVSATLQLARNALPDGVYSNFQVGIVPTDSDAVSLLAADLNLALDGGADSHVQLGQTDLRYGRLNLHNNFGSELLGLSLPLNAEYYLDATAAFVINANDSCTTRAPANVLLYNELEPKAGRIVGDSMITIGTGSTTLTSISAFVGGRASMTFTAPAAEGYVDVEIQAPDWLLSNLDELDQGIEGPGLHCTPGIAATDPAYIEGCTADGNNIDDIPLSRANFGIFKGSDNIIYIREVY